MAEKTKRTKISTLPTEPLGVAGPGKLLGFLWLLQFLLPFIITPTAAPLLDILSSSTVYLNVVFILKSTEPISKER
jgi:hypothetical protein